MKIIESLFCGLIIGCIYFVISYIKSKSTYAKHDPRSDLSVKRISQYINKLRDKLPIPPATLAQLYELPPQYASYIDKNISEQTMQDIANDIGYYLGIPFGIKVHIIDDPGNPTGVMYSDQGAIWCGNGNKELNYAGQYKVIGADHGEIILIKNYKFSFSNYVAILSHEYAHHYLYKHRFDIDNDSDAEIATDIAAVYLGLGHILLRGYEPIQSALFPFFISNTQTININYLGYVTIDTIFLAIVLSAPLRLWNPSTVIKKLHCFYPYRLEGHIRLLKYRMKYNKLKSQRTVIDRQQYIICLHCGSKNRVMQHVASMKPICGKCKYVLTTSCH